MPKPGRGMRQLGIPTVLDRFMQQAMLQVLQSYWDETFSNSILISVLEGGIVQARDEGTPQGGA